MSLTKEQSRRKNHLQRVKMIQSDYEEKRLEHFNEWGWNPTKKNIWRKFIFPKYVIAYYTFIEQMGIDVEAEMEKLKTTIETHKKEIEMKKNQHTLFSALMCLVIGLSSGCGMLSTIGEDKGERYTEHELAEYCADTYPCKPIATTDTVYMDSTIFEIPLDTIIYVDTTVCPPSDSSLILLDTITVEVPGKRIYIPVYRIDSVKHIVDSAAIAACELENKQLRAANTELREMALFVNPDNKDGLPWWWLLFTAIGGYFVRKLQKSKKKA